MNATFNSVELSASAHQKLERNLLVSRFIVFCSSVMAITFSYWVGLRAERIDVGVITMAEVSIMLVLALSAAASIFVVREIYILTKRIEIEWEPAPHLTSLKIGELAPAVIMQYLSVSITAICINGVLPVNAQVYEELKIIQTATLLGLISGLIVVSSMLLDSYEAEAN